MRDLERLNHHNNRYAVDGIVTGVVLSSKKGFYGGSSGSFFSSHSLMNFVFSIVFGMKAA